MTKDEKYDKIINFLKANASEPSQEAIDKIKNRKEYKEAIEKAIKEFNYNEEEAKAFKTGIIWKELWNINKVFKK